MNVDYKAIVPLDIQIVNMAFGLSLALGKRAIRNCVQEFEAYRVRVEGKKIISQMDLEYRMYVVDLLLGIDEGYLADALGAVMIRGRDV